MSKKVCGQCGGHGYLRGGELVKRLNGEMVPARRCEDCNGVGMVSIDFMPKQRVRVEKPPSAPSKAESFRTTGKIWQSMGGRMVRVGNKKKSA